MSMQRYVLVGSVGAGKTSLFNALNNKYGLAMKTQAVAFDDQGGVDTPGEFFNHPRLYNALISTITEAQTIIYVHAADDPVWRMPAGLLAVYQDKTIVAVITKVDLPNVDVATIKNMLITNGFNGPIFEVCTQNPDSIQVLAEYLKLDELSKRKE